MINNVYNNKASFESKVSKELYDTTTSSNVVIKGSILQKDGKNIRIKSDENTLLDIVTKSDLTVKQGEMLFIKKSEIESITKISYDQVEKEKEKRHEEIEELKKAEVQPSDENIDALENLKENGIPATKENILKFASIKSSLNAITMLDVNQLTKMMSSGIDVENMSVFDAKQALSMTDISFSDKFTVALESKINPKISYDEAREISDKLYGSKMGKDIQDIIISLKQNSADVTKENVDKIYDTFSKLYNLKDISNDEIVKAVQIDEKSVSIDKLYNVKNYVSTSSISVSSVSYSVNVNIPTDTQLDSMSDEIIKTLKTMGFSEEELSIAKSIIKQNMDLTKDNIQDIKQIQLDLTTIQNTLDKNIAAMLLKSGQDISTMDIRELLQQIIAIANAIEEVDSMSFTQKEMDMAGALIDAMKQINSNTILSNISVKSILNSSDIGRDVYDKLFSDHGKYSMTSYEKSVSIKTSIVLSSVESIDFNTIDYRNTNISLRHIGEKYCLLKEDKLAQRKVEETLQLEKLEYKVEIKEEIHIKAEIRTHYEYLRTNMRASHITQMLRDGINPLDSDIRNLSQLIRQQDIKQKNMTSTFSKMTKEEISIATNNIVMNSAEPTLANIKKSIELESNKNNYVDKIKEILKIAKDTGFTELEGLSKKIEEHLRENVKQNNTPREHIRQNIEKLYNEIREMEKIVASSERPDKENVKKQLEELSNNIKTSQKLSNENEMIQIPFNMNGESNNANVYAKTKKNKKGKIDPDDMSVLMDINTKNLGKMGFYIKVDNKKLSLKVSGSEESMSKIKNSIEKLDSNLGSLGYDIDFVDLVSPENKAKISFVEENKRDSNSNIDFFI